MTRKFSIAEARNQLPSLVHDAERGSPIELTRRGRPVAVLLSVREYERLSRPRPRLWEAIDAFRKRQDLEGLDVAEAFAGVRDRSPGRGAKW